MLSKKGRGCFFPLPLANSEANFHLLLKAAIFHCTFDLLIEGNSSIEIRHSDSIGTILTQFQKAFAPSDLAKNAIDLVVKPCSSIGFSFLAHNFGCSAFLHLIEIVDLCFDHTNIPCLFSGRCCWLHTFHWCFYHVETIKEAHCSYSCLGCRFRLNYSL